MPDHLTIRQQFTAAFHASGMSQRALARAAKVTQAQISDYLAGKCDLNSTTIDRLFAAMAKAGKT